MRRSTPPGPTVIIPAAGTGRRIVKPLVEVGGRPLLARQVGVVRHAYPDAEVVVVVGHEAERVIRALPPFVKVVENEGYTTSNVARSLGMGLRVASHPRVLFLHGDLVFDADAIAGVADGWTTALVEETGQFGGSEVGACVVDGVVTRFDFGLPVKWAQVAFLCGRELELFREVAWDPAHRMKSSWEALNAVIDRGGRVRAVEPRGLRMVEVDSHRDVERARDLAAGRRPTGVGR